MAETLIDPAEQIAERSGILLRSAVMALVGVALLVLAAVVWALYARAPQTVSGTGIILPATGYAEAGTAVDGEVQTAEVEPGDEVTAGQTLARVDSAGTSVTVQSPVSGTVVEVFARPGRQTSAGQPLFILLPSGVGSITRAFLPAQQAESVDPGMETLISPASAPRGQYGSILGRVDVVAPAPVTRERLLAVTGDNNALTDFLLSKGPVQEVTVEMESADTPSGYRWTIAKGPAFPIASSTLAEVNVIVQDNTVASLVLG